jgi:hypothetical protein
MPLLDEMGGIGWMVPWSVVHLHGLGVCMIGLWIVMHIMAGKDLLFLLCNS